MKREIRRMPNGKETTSSTRYLKAWKAMSNILLTRYGLQVISFDPDFHVCDERDRQGSFTLPLYVAIRMCNVAALHSLPDCNLVGDNVAKLKKQLHAFENFMMLNPTNTVDEHVVRHQQRRRMAAEIEEMTQPEPLLFKRW